MAGAGYKLFNTGDVLTAAQVNTYLMEQSVMVFANAAARTTALSGVVAEGMLSYLKDTDQVEVYNGSAWVASDDPNAIQNSIVDAKGDLITATANDTPARLAVGDSGSILLADSAATTGLRWSGANQQNPVINSGFDIAQRGTSFTNPNSVYTLDRWYTGATTNKTISRVSTNDTTNLPFIQYACRVQRTNGTTTTAGMDIAQSIETANSIPYAGKTVTLSFYARCGANYSPTSSALVVYLFTGTGTDQNIFNGYTGQALPINTSVTLTTTWQRFTLTATLGSTVTEMGPYFLMNPTGTAGANDWFEITGVQIDIGSTALPYRKSASTLAGELAACQRYYERLIVTGTGNAFGLGFADSTTAAAIKNSFKVTKRIAPTALEQSGTATDYALRYSGGNVTQCSTVPTFSAATPDEATTTFTLAAGLTAGQGLSARAATTAAYLGWSAEL